jgi:transcription termination factor Rho
MKEYSSVTFTSLVKLIPDGDSLDFYVMPTVNTKKKSDDSPLDEYTNKILLTYIKNNRIYFVQLNEREIENEIDLRPGQKITMYGPKKGVYMDKKLTVWKTAVEFNGTKFCYGQNILISAPPGGGKTTAVMKLARAYEDSDSSLMYYGMLVGERFDDSLFPSGEEDKTINCDSSAPIHVQLSVIYMTLTKALRDAYNGRNVVLAIDSLTRLILGLTGLYSETHMVSGGISFDVTVMASNLMKLGGTYGKGTLTMIGTCFYSKSNNTWKTVYSELSAAATAEIKVSRDPFNEKRVSMSSFTRRKEEKVYPYKDILGIRFYY